MEDSLLGLVKEALWARVVRLDSLRRLSIRYCVDNNLLPSLLTGISGNTLRDTLALPLSDHQSQLNQDIFALFMNRFRPGFFLEIGANDGFTFSNTVYLEKEFGWKGILVEANPRYMTSLSARKNSVIVNKAVSAQRGQVAFIDAGLYGGLESSLDRSHERHTHGAARITIECMALQEILDVTSAPSRVDFVSVDVEGSEVSIVEQMVTCNRRFGCGCIEVNSRRTDYSQIVLFLERAGYRVVWENQTKFDLFFIDSQIRLANCESF